MPLYQRRRVRQGEGYARFAGVPGFRAALAATRAIPLRHAPLHPRLMALGPLQPSAGIHPLQQKEIIMKHLEAYGSRKVRDMEKSYWFRIGRAFPNKNGSIAIRLDAMPAPVDGQYRIVLFPPDEKMDDEQ